MTWEVSVGGSRIVFVKGSEGMMNRIQSDLATLQMIPGQF